MRRYSALIMMALLVVALGAARPAAAQIFRSQDWLMHRGSPERQGANGGETNLTPEKKSLLYVWPKRGDMAAEMEVDNTGLPKPPMFPPLVAGKPLWSNIAAGHPPAFPPHVRLAGTT